MLRILLLSWNYPPVLGGIEYMVQNLFVRFRNFGHAVRLLTACAPDAPAEPDVQRSPRRGLVRFVLFCLTAGFGICRRWKPQVIYCGTVVTAPPAVFFKWIFGIPFVVLVHGSDVLRPGWFYQCCVGWLLRRADRVIANSDPTRLSLLERGVKPARIAVIHPGVRVEDFLHEPDSAPPPVVVEAAGRRVLLSVGRLIRRKGVLEFVERVMPALAAEFPDVLLLIVGDDATSSLVHSERLRDTIAAKVEQLNLSGHVQLLGSVDQETLLHLFFAADVFIMPCLDLPGDVEGFGIVLLEAALAQTPCVATRSGGIPQAVQENVTGIVVPPGDWEAMRVQVAGLLRDESRRQQMGQAGRERALRSFSWDAIAAEHVRLLEGCRMG